MEQLNVLKTQLQQFKSNKYVQGSKQFLETNSIIAKFAFLILHLFFQIQTSCES